MNRLEARIRDYLALHIQLLEDGLTFVSKEYELSNRLGSNGFVDLLARDRFGHLVVIEIKRSDQAARSAIHEITKYVALLRADQGLGRDQIRAMLLSTEWNELAVPFSEYLKVCEVPTEGLVITAEESGVVTSVAPFTTVNTSQPLVISRYQDIILFAEAQQRDQNVDRVAKAATRSGLSDFALLKVDHVGGDERIIFPHGIYLVFSSPFQTMSAEDIKTAKRKIVRDEGLDEPDESFLVKFREKLGPLGDDGEIGTPEKLAGMILGGWNVVVIHRAGRYTANKALVSDDQLIRDATKMEGGAQYYITRTVSPKYAPSWRKLRSDIDLVLLGDDRWMSILPRILSEIGTQHRTATVSLHIYQPARIVFGLAKLFGSDDKSYLPSLQMVVAGTDEVVIYWGALGWNGHLVGISGEQWLTEAFGSPWEFVTKQHLGLVHDQEVEARRKLGIESFILEVRDPGGRNEKASLLSVHKGRLVRDPADSWAIRSMAEFASQNRHFGLSLLSVVAQFSSDWV